MPTLYLVKQDDGLLSECTCPEARVSLPQPSLEPWTGGGWLFACMSCRRPFSFARATRVPESLEELARGDLGVGAEPSQVASWVEQTRLLLETVREGKEYVFLDGAFLPTHARRVTLEGWFADHDLGTVPQVAARENPTLVPGLLASEDYWMDGARQRLVAALARGQTPA